MSSFRPAFLRLARFFCLTLSMSAAPALAAEITGAGATFPYPLYYKWAETYQSKLGIVVNYRAVGSGAGLKQIAAGAVDFGASDMPLKQEDLDKQGLVQFPAVIGGAVPVVNLPGIKSGELRMTGALLADVFLGKVTKWNDPRLVELNPVLRTKDMPIQVVHRSDGSGTTFIFTNYLSKVSPEWKSRLGEGPSVAFPVGVGGSGNDMVAANVMRLAGAIGYVEYAQAVRSKLPIVQLQNKAGEFVTPSSESFRAAAANADWAKAPGYYLILTDQPGAGVWPMTGATFILLQKVAQRPAQTREVVKFFEWAFSDEGDKMATTLDYVPMPQAVVNQIRGNLKANLKDAKGAQVL